MKSEVEKIAKALAALAEKKADREQKRDRAAQQKAELESKRGELLTRISDGEESARAQLRTLDNTRQTLAEDEEAFAASAVEVGAAFEAMKKRLAHAQREEAIACLEKQIADLSTPDCELETAIARVRQTADALYAAITNVTKRLTELDPVRFESRFTWNLVSVVNECVFYRFDEMADTHAVRRPGFSERVRVPLEGAIRQLRFMNQEKIELARGEKLYRACVRVFGLRGVDIAAGGLIGLLDEEAAEFLKLGQIELEQDATKGFDLLPSLLLPSVARENVVPAGEPVLNAYELQLPVRGET